MSLKRNILANYASQAYVTLASLIMLPVYLRYMGAEAYGLAGFFTMLNAFFMLLDVGLSPTLSRETARFQGGAIDADTLRGLVRILETIFVTVAVLALAAFALASDYLASQWLKVEHLPISEVRAAILLMGLTIPLRWMSGLYRGAVNGFERQVWLAAFNILIATIRFVGVLAVFITIGTAPTAFFGYQLAVAILELAGLSWMSYRLLPQQTVAQPLSESWRTLKGLLGFSLTVAFTGAVWVLVTQVDKLVLSRMLSLSDYGYYSLAVVVAAGVNVTGAPIYQALLPRLTSLVAQGKQDEAIALYRKASQLLAVLAIPVALVLAMHARPVLWAWTGNPEAVEKSSTILIFYALGNGLLTLTGLAYVLQYAKGDLRLHLIGQTLMLVFMVPCLVWAASRWGALGAGVTWVTAICVYFLVWLPLIHNRMATRLHWPWLGYDVIPIVLSAGLTTYLLSLLLPSPTDRLGSGSYAIINGVLILLVAGSASSVVRSLILKCSGYNSGQTQAN